MKICICICGLHRSAPLVINTLNNLFSDHDLEYILSVSYSFDNNYINTNNDINYDNPKIIKKIIIKDYDKDFMNSLNYSNKIVNSIKLIENKYDLYIILRTDLNLNVIDLNVIKNNKLYLSDNNLNPYSINSNRVNDNIIITKNYSLLTKLIDLHEYNYKYQNYLDINLYKYLEQNKIPYDLINIGYKLILSECNIIAISGDSGSGKTTISKILNLMFKKSCLLETDRYHKWERGDKNYKQYTHLNPKANYLERMSQDVLQFKIGLDIYQVDYDHSTGKFTQKQEIKNKKNMILCGLHTLYQENINEILNIKIYLDTDRELIKKWKIQRDVNERGYSIEKVLKQIELREEDFNKYILKQKENADIIINFYELNNNINCNFIIRNNIMIMKIIENLLSSEYKVIYNNDYICIKLKDNINDVDDNIKNIIIDNQHLFINNYYIQIFKLISLIIK
jgi:uridine kinase